MGADKFVGAARPGEVADLGACVYPLEGLACEGVPEPNGSVGCATSRSQDAVLRGGGRGE